MSRSLVIVIGSLVAAAVLSAAAIVLILKSGVTKPTISEEQRATRERFFGSSKDLPPIEKGQEMRPRW